MVLMALLKIPSDMVDQSITRSDSDSHYNTVGIPQQAEPTLAPVVTAMEEVLT